MAFTYRSIQVAGSWTAQRYEDSGTSVVHQLLGVYSDQAGGQGGNGALSAKEVADLVCGALAGAFGGTFQSNNNDPFE